MAGFNPQGPRAASCVSGIALLAGALLLGGCTGNTYGTGTPPGVQTVKDLAGIALIGGGKAPPIDYEPRPKVVLPPTVAALPPPGDANATAPTPPDWPNDPDQTSAKIKADAAAREASGAPLPALKLPEGAISKPVLSARDNNPAFGPASRDVGDDSRLTDEQSTAVRKLMADARNSVSVDANGKPVRKYLIDPPSEYRQPDPTEPTTFTVTKKKFHWWWQKDTGDDETAQGGLTPEAEPLPAATASDHN